MYIWKRIALRDSYVYVYTWIFAAVQMYYNLDNDMWKRGGRYLIL